MPRSTVDLLVGNQQPSNSFVAIPAEAFNKIARENGSVAFATYKAPTTSFDDDDYLIEIYPPSSSAAGNCSTSLIGISKPILIRELKGGVKLQWGYVDFFDTYNSGEGGWDFDGDPPLCRPPGVPGDAAYALCAEKDGKTVVICIAQQKDNPELAKQIFESFRWTDGEGAGGAE